MASVQEKTVLIVYVDGVNLMSGNTNTTVTNTDVLLDTNMEAGLEVNTQKTKYMLTSHHQTTRQNHYVNAGNKSFKNMATLQ